jgi:arsenate reductase
MAATWFNLLADRSKAIASSAGTEPAPNVDAQVIEAMREIGVDLSRVRPRALTQSDLGAADIVVSMGCGPLFLRAALGEIDAWTFDDPRDYELEGVRGIRNAIRERVERLLRVRRWERAA